MFSVLTFVSSLSLSNLLPSAPSLFSIFSGYFFKDFFVSEKYAQLWMNSNVSNISTISLHHKNNLINFIPTILSFFGILLIFYFYFYNQKLIFYLKNKFNSFYEFLLNKWYFDELYDYLFVKNIIKLSDNLWKKIDIGLIDKLGQMLWLYQLKEYQNFSVIYKLVIFIIMYFHL